MIKGGGANRAIELQQLIHELAGKPINTGILKSMS